MRKAIIAFFIVTAVLFATFFLMRSTMKPKLIKEKPRFNLSKPEKREIDIKGEKHSLTIYKYDPPYLETQLLRSKEEADCSTPEGTHLALSFADGRDRDWYLSLHDENSQKFLLKKDEELGGELLNEELKGSPLPTPEELHKTYSKLLYKVEYEYTGKKYAIIHERIVSEGHEYAPCVTIFVKQGDTWLWTDDLDRHPIKKLVGLKSYKEIEEILKEGSWSVE